MSLTLERTSVLRAPRGGKLGPAVAERLRQRRKQIGLTLLELARRVGTTPQTIQRLETGNMMLTLDWIERFAAALEMLPFELFADGASQALLDRAFVARAETAALKAKLSSFVRSMEEACREPMKP